jgi:hypothetical protein
MAHAPVGEDLCAFGKRTGANHGRKATHAGLDLGARAGRRARVPGPRIDRSRVPMALSPIHLPGAHGRHLLHLPGPNSPTGRQGHALTRPLRRGHDGNEPNSCSTKIQGRNRPWIFPSETRRRSPRAASDARFDASRRRRKQSIVPFRHGHAPETECAFTSEEWSAERCHESR